MKYIRKIAAPVMALIFAAAVAIGVCVIFAVRNVNVTLMSYSSDTADAEAEIAAVKEKVLANCRGTIIGFLSEGDVVACLDEGYTLEKFEKVYPCTVEITVRQRREAFAVQTGEEYSVYDDGGNFLKTADTSLNSLDSAPNVILKGVSGAEDVKTVAGVCAVFALNENFSHLRSVVESVELLKADTKFGNDKLVFLLRCGLTLEIHDFTVRTEEKMSKAHKEFALLSGEQKLRGTIYSLVNVNGEVTATYNPNT